MIVISGASGFLGSAIRARAEARGERVVTIGRAESDAMSWPPAGEAFRDDARRTLDGARAVIHLAGATIGVRWTAAAKAAIRSSRVPLTDSLSRTLAGLPAQPSVFVAASAVGIYGDCGDAWLDESSAPGTDYLGVVAREWEAATTPAREAGIRTVNLRMGVVLGRGGGMVAKLRLPTLLGGGARLGSGRQWMSWIALADLLRVIDRALDDSAMSGPVNAVSPSPVTNADFTREFASALRRPALVGIPAFVLRAAFGEMADAVLLASQRVRPSRLEAAGFQFEHPTLAGALAEALR